MTKAVIYARVSSREQEQGYSIDAQLEKCRQFAADEGCEVVEEFVATESAWHIGRAEFGRMVEYVVENKVKAIICHKVDRFSRNMEDALVIRSLARDYGIITRFVEGGEYSDTPEGKLQLTILTGLAEYKSDNLARDVRKGREQKIKQGGWPHRAPYGYRNNKDSRTIEVDPVASDNVLYLFTEYASGRHGLKSLILEFKQSGRQYRNGAELSKAQLQCILKNPFYVRLLRVNGRLHKGTHERIVSDELFEKVQTVRASRNRPRVTRKKRFVYSGLMTCAKCGCTITAEEKIKTRADGTEGPRYVYWHCTNGRGGCKREYVPERVLDEQFEAAVKRVQIDPSYCDLMIDTLRENHKDESESRKRAIAALRKKQTALKKRVAGAYDDYLDGKIAEAFWQEKTRTWQAEIEDINIQIAAHDSAHYSLLEAGVRIIELARNAHHWYVSQQDQAKRRSLLSLLLSNCTLDGATLHYDYRKPFDIFAEGQGGLGWWG